MEYNILKFNLSQRFPFIANILATFIGVILAFWLTAWNEDRKLKAEEIALLKELHEELKVDLTDIKDNLQGHESAVRGINGFGKVMLGKQKDDSLGIFPFK